MKNVSYAASNNIGKAERLSSDSENLPQQVLENDLDTSEREVTLSGAEKYLSLAEEALSGNSVAANNYALKAMALFEKAIKCLTGLLR